MEKTDIVIVIADTAFAIDMVRKELRQWGAPQNTIPFHALKDEGDYFTLVWDKAKRNIHTGMRRAGIEAAGITDVIIPAVLLRDVTVGDELRNQLNSRSASEMWGIYIGNEALANRLSGILPHIDLAGIDFTVDWRLKELRETAVPNNRISLKGLPLSDAGDEYLCLFNTKTHAAHQDVRGDTALPADVVLLKIPYELTLDPVGVAREYGLPDTDLLCSFPIREKLAATVVPAAEWEEWLNRE